MLGIPSEGGGRTFESCRVRHTGSSVEMEAKEKIAPSAIDGGADRRTPLRTEPGYGVADDCQSRFRPQDQLRVAKVSDCDAIGLARTSASHTCVVRPLCIGRAVQTTMPSRAVPIRLLLSSMVVKPLAPAGRPRKVP